jgi:ribosomal protein L2
VDFVTGAPIAKTDDVIARTSAIVPQIAATSNVYTVSKQAQIIKSYESMKGGKLRIFKGRVIPQLSTPRVPHSGRNNTGKITTRHQGGGNKNRLRLIDYKRGRKNTLLDRHRA